MTKAVVFLDLTPMDDTLLRYVKRMDQALQLDEVCLVHYVELQDLSEDYIEHFPNMERPIEEILEEEIEEYAQDSGLDKDRYSIKVHSRGRQDALLKWIEEEGFDLCIFGKKVVHRGTGVFAGKLARLVRKSILFVTETARFHWNKVLVPIDFSYYSQKSLQFARDLLSDTEVEIITLNVYHVPPTYFPFVKESNEKMVQEVRKTAQRQLKQFCDKNAPGENLRQEVLHSSEKSTATIIYDFARREHVDLIIIGIKGKTDDDGLLMGSVAQRLIQSDRDIPVLLVKSDPRNRGF